MVTVDDAVGEWWIRPLATYVHRPYSRTVFGAVGHDGAILACEVDHSSGKVSRHQVAMAGADDHNAPALWVADDRRGVIIWSNHNEDCLLRLKVSDQDTRLGSFADSPEHVVDTGGRASYAQVHRIAHLSDDTRDTFWVFFRRDNTEWMIQTLSIEQATGTVALGGRLSLLKTAGRQAYISTADAYHPAGNQVIRIAWGYNPAQPVHAIRYFELDCVTGTIRSPFDVTLRASIRDLAEDNWINDEDVAPMLPEMESGRSRRLFYVRPGPDRPAVAYAEWDVSAPDAATYYVTEFSTTDDLTTHELGIAGPRVGYTPEANYIAGLAFEDPSHHRVVLRASSDGRGDRVDRIRLTDKGSQATVLASQPTVDGRLIRPCAPVNGGPIAALVSNMTHYGEDYRDFRGKIIGLADRAEGSTENPSELARGTLGVEVPWDRAELP